MSSSVEEKSSGSNVIEVKADEQAESQAESPNYKSKNERSSSKNKNDHEMSPSTCIMLLTSNTY